MLLANRTVLLVDGDVRTLEWLGRELKAEGARAFAAPDAATALWGASETLPDVVISELDLPGTDAHGLLTELRAVLGAQLRALAFSGNRALLARSRDVPGGFDKELAKPAPGGVIIDVLCCLLGPAPPVTPPGALALEVLTGMLLCHDYRGLLASVSAVSAHRYAALFRFDGPRLQNVWTYDRAEPLRDRFPSELVLAETPCQELAAEPRSFWVTDAWVDPRVPPPRRHDDMRAFAGVPLLDDGGDAQGALCVFDAEPRPCGTELLDALERVARLYHFHRRKARSR